VLILQQTIDAIVAHARETAPDECCGLLVGTEAAIDEAVRTRNLEAGPSRFQVDPADHIALLKRLRGTSRTIAGAYHSHPRSSATPSPSDVAEAFYPDFVYLIVSLAVPARPECRAWRIRDGAAEEIALLVGPVTKTAADPQ
jgi:proteasome lid subunit RPN8/RPN11